MKNNVFMGIALISSIAIGLQAEYIRDDGKNIVLDSTNGLIWQDDEVVKTTNRAWTDAIAFCEGLTLGGYDDWRLPNLRELESIANRTYSQPKLSLIFKNYYDSYYWSSTTVSGRHDDASTIGFNRGQQSFAPKAYDNNNWVYTRCVRGGL